MPEYSKALFYQLFSWVYFHLCVCLCVCLCPAGGERAYQGGEGGGQIPPVQLPHQVHKHDGPPSRLFYWLVFSCGMWSNRQNTVHLDTGWSVSQEMTVNPCPLFVLEHADSLPKVKFCLRKWNQLKSCHIFEQMFLLQSHLQTWSSHLVFVLFGGMAESVCQFWICR